MLFFGQCKADQFTIFLFFCYRAREFRVVGDESHQRSMPVFSHSSGRVLWYAPGHFVGRCESDVSNFPFDKHTCKFVVCTMLCLLGIPYNYARHRSLIGSVSAWHTSGPEFDPQVRHILSWRLGHEKISMAILPLPLIQEEQFSVTGERIFTKYW